MTYVEFTQKLAKTKFGKAVRAIKKEIRQDVEAIRQRDPAAKSDVEIVLLYSGLHAILAYRVAHKLYVSGHSFSARAVSQIARFFTGIEIHPGATIGKGLVIDHGMGIVIGETTEIGDNCTLYQGVTLGGTGKDVGKRHPTIGNNVLVGAGAKVLGPIFIDDNSKVAANAVVLKNIEENSTAVGIPARVVRQGGRRVDDLDQVHIPDPVSQELNKLKEQIAELEKQIAALEEKIKGSLSDPNGRHECRAVFSYYCDFRADLRKTPEKIVIRNCRFEQTRETMRLEFTGLNRWCRQRGLKEITFENCFSPHIPTTPGYSNMMMPVTGGPPMLLTRNLFYTALTRARALVVLVGREEIVHLMVENDHVLKRYTTLSERLQHVSTLVPESLIKG